MSDFYSAQTFKKTPYYQALPSVEKTTFDALTEVFHFKTNRYVLENLINWDKVPNDPIYELNFLRPHMLSSSDYQALITSIQESRYDLANTIRQLKPAIVNVDVTRIPVRQGQIIQGIYHSFRTLLNLFPNPMTHTCHAYCSYCYRWKQFTSNQLQSSGSGYSYKNPQTPIPYLLEHPEITDVLFTGADPLVLPAHLIRQYIEPILSINTIKVIRISSKSLAWWPYRFTTDKDADELLRCFEYIVSQGKHLNFCAHFTHARELETGVVQEAIRRIQSTGAVIRCQGPIIQGINDTVQDWVDLWSKQVALGLIPYYMFMEADHNDEASFRIPLAKALDVFRTARSHTTGLARTVRGPVFMNDIHRVLLDGIVEIDHKKLFVLKCLQSPYPESEGQIKLIPYDENTRSAGDLVKMFTPQAVLDEMLLSS